MGAQGTKSEKLTPAEQKLIVDTWDMAMKRRTEFAVEIFIKIFTQAPAAQQMFKLLKDIPLEELRAHKRMKAHGLRVIAQLRSMVDELRSDDFEEELLVEMFANVARTHRDMDVVKAHYDLLGKVIIETFQDFLGGEFGGAEKGAWLKAYTAMENAILTTYKELDSRESTQG